MIQTMTCKVEVSYLCEEAYNFTDDIKFKIVDLIFASKNQSCIIENRDGLRIDLESLPDKVIKQLYKLVISGK